nr:DUF3265 domain-containing protein [uncultured Vibrio sp.]
MVTLTNCLRRTQNAWHFCFAKVYAKVLCHLAKR